MFKRLLPVIVFLLFSLQVQADVPNLSQVKKQLVEYVESGRYHAAIHDKVQTLRVKLKARMATLKPGQRQKLAFVFDIDETLLSNYHWMKRYNFGGNKRLWEQMDVSGEGVSIKPVKDLYHYAQSLGIAIFIITGRPDYEREATIAILEKEGITNWNGLFFLPSDADTSIIVHKGGVRCNLEAQGYKIIVNIGDQHSDLMGMCQAEHSVKLPNPFYEVSGDQKSASTANSAANIS